MKKPLKFCALTPVRQPKQINARRVWDRLEIDGHFDALKSAKDYDKFERAWALTISDWTPLDAVKTDKEPLNIPRTAEEWEKAKIQWRLNVVASPLQSRELVGLARLYEVKSERIKRIKGASCGTIERLHARGYVDPTGDLPGMRITYKITEAGKRAWEKLPDPIREAVIFTTVPLFR